MANILLIEPAYRSKFPPLGLLRIGRFHRENGDAVTFARGRVAELKNLSWHRIYVSSLYTWELPRTVKTIKYYSMSVDSAENLIVGGIGATLMPNYIARSADCTIVTGPIDSKNRISGVTRAIAHTAPDYAVLDSSEHTYEPADSYFVRISVGCKRRCRFCAVPRLEPRLKQLPLWHEQIRDAREEFGERQHLVFLDNNVLALPALERKIGRIVDEGFWRGAKRNKRERLVDFNQGIDSRLISRKAANALSRIPLKPVRLAFDRNSMERSYRKAISELVHVEFNQFTNYMMFNYQDEPEDLYRRMETNFDIADEFDVRITGFPMRFIPVDDVSRRWVSPRWKWRYLRGVQCVLMATRGLVSTNREFFYAAFGESIENFFEILSMPDRYIIFREKYKRGPARAWRRLFRNLSATSRSELMDILEILNKQRDKKKTMARYRKSYGRILEHYYPGGKVVSS